MPSIIVDSRESKAISQTLRQLGADVKVRTIQPGDYVLSENCGVERKSFPDFLHSLFDGRLFDQAQRLSQSYSMPILVVEGVTSYSLTTIHNPLVFWGALAKAAAYYRLQIIFTPNQKQTAHLLYCLANKLQCSSEQEQFEAKHKPHAYTLAQCQEYAVQSLPQVGPKRARLLLEKFGSVSGVFGASAKQLQSVQGLGLSAAGQIDNFLNAKYFPYRRNIANSTSKEVVVS